MNQTQATQTLAAKRIILQVRDQQPLFSADQNQLNLAVAVDQQTDLPPDLKRQLHQTCCKLLTTAFAG